MTLADKTEVRREEGDSGVGRWKAHPLQVQVEAAQRCAQDSGTVHAGTPYSDQL